ncbi:ABC transporter permease [Tessaracoccus sp. HDW20]|uniref:FtsX-like permease family protein n=1 Tax=Tessaracoccus coleopterorum TaxID=2714950 RepID=UPI0018D49EEC|nr:ABC transporter permease [Tessaracoccus coleopterorum]
MPVALTRETSSASTLVIGDRLDLVAFGTRIPATVAAITDVVPSTPGNLGILIDSVALSRLLAARGADLPWPDEMWAGLDGDPTTARAAAEALPGVASATTATGATAGTADVASAALWVASACAVALAAAGLAASAATMTATRRPEVAVLRALGMSPSAQARSRAVENGAVLALSTLLGIGAGWAVGGAVAREVALSATLENPSFEVVLRFTWLPWAVILTVGALAAAAVVAWQASLVRRQALDSEYREEVR